MGWADKWIEELKKGNIVSFRPKGNSMIPKIKSGQLCTVSPDLSNLKVGDIVLCKVAGNQYLHLIQSIKLGGYLICNNRGRSNGFTSHHNVYGRLIKVED